MGRLLPVLGLLSVLCALQCWSVSGASRLPRGADAPAQVDCQMSDWGQWTKCDPCTKQRHRSRSVLKFGQFGGARCRSSLGEHQLCVPDKPCEEEIIDCGRDFQCDNGRCISERLRCNGDNDCGDNTDEDCDNDPKPVCRGDPLELSEVARTSGNGLNILGMDTVANPFDNEFFNGLCSKVRDGNTRQYYRMPWNTVKVDYKTLADKTFTSEVYTDTAELVQRILKESEDNLEVKASIKVTPSEFRKKGDKDKKAEGAKEGGGDGEGSAVADAAGKSLTIGGEVGYDKSKTESVERIKEFKLLQNKEFLRIFGKIQLATFQMRTRGLVLSPTFIDDLKNLPPFYEKGEYFAFLEMYGTHYAVSGSVGGKYELVYVLDSLVLKKKDITKDDVKECHGWNAGLNAEAAGITGGINVKNPKCKKDFGNEEDKPDKDAIIEKVVSFVEGGSVAHTAKLNLKLEKKEPIGVDDFVDWAASLPDNPVIIKHKSQPIFTLIPVDMKNAYNKSKYLEKAIQDYMDEYSVCKCQPCRNGGTTILVDGECWCQCPPRFEGLACEKLKSELHEKPSPAINGRWSCWHDSSSCVEHEKSQTRQCNNPAPQNGGKPCAGDSVRKVVC
ncbi:complement component C9-like [Hyperolius riggenbachi]|uniref:complement component C9-like n=1 Tax=Hyperolius riggenbachi TaxID=752182 RepID=UPI0035A3CC49